MADVIHETSRDRFLMQVDGHDCVLEYDLQDKTMTITHTRVPDAVGGRGLAATLTKVALDTARRHGWQVIPRCWYVAAYIKRHPQYADLMHTL